MAQPCDLKALQGHLKDGHKVKGCEVRGEEIFIIFDDFECLAEGFKIGEFCRPFAEFVVEAGLEKRVDLVERYLMAIESKDIQGEICWPGFDDDDQWPDKTP